MSLPPFTRPQSLASHQLDGATPSQIDTDLYWTSVEMEQRTARLNFIAERLRVTTYLSNAEVARLESERDDRNEEWEVLEAHRDMLETAYNKRRWSRAWLVTSSDGHIHAGPYCTTFQPNTRCTLLPQASGMSYVELVDAAGEKACDVCYGDSGREVKEVNRRCKTLAELIKDRYDFDENTGCWIWRGQPKDTGYGQVKVGGRTGRVVNAHQAVYEVMVGTVPEGKELDHLCRVKMCVNPAHLEPVTHRENVLRGASPAARSAQLVKCPKGHPYNAENTYWRPDGKGRGCRTCRGWTGGTFTTLRDPLTAQEQDAKDAEKAAKAQTAAGKAITAPEGGPLYAAPEFDHEGLNGSLIKTEIAANRKAMEDLKRLGWYGVEHAHAKNWIETVRRMVLALAAKRGTHARDELDAMVKKVEKSIKRDGGTSMFDPLMLRSSL